MVHLPQSVKSVVSVLLFCYTLPNLSLLLSFPCKNQAFSQSHTMTLHVDCHGGQYTPERWLDEPFACSCDDLVLQNGVLCTMLQDTSPSPFACYLPVICLLLLSSRLLFSPLVDPDPHHCILHYALYFCSLCTTSCSLKSVLSNWQPPWFFSGPVYMSHALLLYCFTSSVFCYCLHSSSCRIKQTTLAVRPLCSLCHHCFAYSFSHSNSSISNVSTSSVFCLLNFRNMPATRPMESRV